MASRIDSLSAELGNVPDAAVTPAAPAAPAAHSAAAAGERTGFRVLSAISFAHMLNDMIQSLILAIYPMLKGGFNLSFVQIGLLTLTYQITASLLQPLVGLYTDKHPKPHSLAVGMGFTLAGLLLLSVAPSYGVLLVAAALVGTGSSIFHPESSRVARMASGGRHGLAQSIFQVGGNVGSAAGPLLAAVVVHTQAASPGCRWRPCWRSRCCGAWAAGMASGWPSMPARRARRWPARRGCRPAPSRARWRC